MSEDGILKKAVVAGNRQIANGIYSLVLFAPDLAMAARPGQFAMISVSGGADPFLRRPFSFAGIDQSAGTVCFIYQITGRGTASMSGWETNRQTDILGPLGNGFSWDESLGLAILAGGGLGIAPLLPFAKELRLQGIETAVFAGAKSRDLLLGLPQFSEYGCEIRVATEDGSGGAAGFITGPLEEYMSARFPLSPSAADHAGQSAERGLFACGPTLFLKAVAGLCVKYKLNAQLSMEERMGCGFGVCMGCSIETRAADGAANRKRVCRDGPVFAAGEVFYG